MQNEIRYVDLFGGIGGFRLGIEKAKIKAKCVLYSDIDKFATKVYNKNFKEDYKPTDIRKIKARDLPEFDLLCGGFPCQAFSIAGKRKGFEDSRGTLFFEIARIVQAKKPSIILLENVKGLLSHERGETFAVIIQTLEELGYDVQWMVLNSRFFGVPQNRERVFIIGSLREKCRPEILPFKSSSKRGNQNQIQRKKTIKCKRIMLNTKNKNSPLPILRRLTPIECERLQGFPDGWTEGVSDYQRYKQLGNSVTVDVVKKISKHLFSK